MVNKMSREKTSFFTPEGKKHWNRMPMGTRNAHAFFICMILEMKKEWTERYNEQGAELIHHIIMMFTNLTPPEFITKAKDIISANPETEFRTGNPMSVAIVDDILWASRSVISLLAFFAVSLQVFQHYTVSFNLKKFRFFPTRAEFVGFDLLAEGNTPAKSKYDAIGSLARPVLFSDLIMFIGMLGFYSKRLVLYKIRIVPWRRYMKQRPIMQNDKEEEAKLLTTLWTSKDDELFGTLKNEILAGPILKRPDYDSRFYVKTDWSQNRMGGALCQPDCNEAEELAMLREIEGGKCELDKTISGARLRVIETIARACKWEARNTNIRRKESRERADGRS
jgi:hypothetical protein